DFPDQLELRLWDRTHGHHDGSMEAASRTAKKIGGEHRNQGAEFDVAHPYPRLDQGMLEGQAATEQERDQIVAPQITDLPSLLGQLASTVDSIAGKIGSKIGTRGRAHRFRIARRRDLDQGAWLGVAGAESGEFGGCLLREDDQISLLAGWALSTRAAVPFTAT